MDFYRIHPIDLNKVRLTPRYDLEVDGSFTAFDIVGDIDTRGLLCKVFSRFTVLKFQNGVVLLQIKCKYDQNDKRSHTIETYGICSAEEVATMDKLYYRDIGDDGSSIYQPTIGGKWYDEIFNRCHPFASSTVRA